MGFHNVTDIFYLSYLEPLDPLMILGPVTLDNSHRFKNIAEILRTFSGLVFVLLFVLY